MGYVEQITILLVDDNRIFLSAVRNFLAQLPEVLIVGEAHDGQEALTLAAQLKPDLVLLDIAMPVMNGLEAAQALNAFARPPHIVFLSMHDNASYRSAAQDLGARGFVGKSDFVVSLIPLISSLVSDLTLQKSAALVVTHGTP
jgi:DNA-binding NarL/FixJ family response regulator